MVIIHQICKRKESILMDIPSNLSAGKTFYGLRHSWYSAILVQQIHNIMVFHIKTAYSSSRQEVWLFIFCFQELALRRIRTKKSRYRPRFWFFCQHTASICFHLPWMVEKEPGLQSILATSSLSLGHFNRKLSRHHSQWRATCPAQPPPMARRRVKRTAKAARTMAKARMFSVSPFFITL